MTQNSDSARTGSIWIDMSVGLHEQVSHRRCGAFLLSDQTMMDPIPYTCIIIPRVGSLTTLGAGSTLRTVKQPLTQSTSMTTTSSGSRMQPLPLNCLHSRNQAVLHTWAATLSLSHRCALFVVLDPDCSMVSLACSTKTECRQCQPYCLKSVAPI